MPELLPLEPLGPDEEVWGYVTPEDTVVVFVYACGLASEVPVYVLTAIPVRSAPGALYLNGPYPAHIRAHTAVYGGTYNGVRQTYGDRMTAQRFHDRWGRKVKAAL
jgi:hypothetical protein